MSYRKQSGFTLLEMVIAIGIFAIIGAISYVTLNQFLQTREVLVERNGQIRNLQRSFSLLVRDIRYMTSRSIRDGLGDTISPLVVFTPGEIGDGELFEFTTVVPSFGSTHWHRLMRVSWGLHDNRIVRQTWAVLDRDFDSESIPIVLLDRVSSVEINYYVRNVDSGLLTTVSDLENESGLPLGIEVILRTEDDITYRRIVEVAGAL